MRSLFSIAGALLLFSSTCLHAASGDQNWDPQFNWPGPGGEILSVATHNGQIYAGGFFSTTNGPVQVWNGAQWTTIGQVYGYPQAVVYDMAFVGNYLYIAGTFTNVNGVAANGFARWDGANWTSVGFSGSLAAVAVSGNNLYVAGGFTNATADGPVATNIACWDGAAWHPLGAGLGVPGNGVVEALAIQSGTIYAGGLFTNSGSILMTNLAVWNGSTWSQVGGGVSSIVYALAFNGGNLIVGGNFSQAGTTPATSLAQWNGSSWSMLGTGIAGGSPFSDITRLAVFNGSVYASGTFTSAGGVGATNIASWNGFSWSSLGSGVFSAAVTRLFSNVTNLYVGGNFLYAGGKIANGMASWDGANWSSIGPNGRMNGLSAPVEAMTSDGTNLYAGGTFTAAGQTAASYIARFDGTNWYPLGTGIGPASTTIVRAMAWSTNGLYVGGEFSSAGGVNAANMALWNGTNWSALGSGPGGVVFGIIVRTDGVYVAGAELDGSGPNYFTPIFMRWDGSNWYSALNLTNDFFAEPFNIPNPEMDAIATSGSNIYVGGQFSFTQFDPSNISDGTNCPDILSYNLNYGWASIMALASIAMSWHWPR